MARVGIGEVLHFNSARFRAVGVGNLNMFLRSLDDIRNIEFGPLILQSATNRETTVLVNFKDQYAQLELNTTEINEVFTISKIIIFKRPSETGYPQ